MSDGLDVVARRIVTHRLSDGKTIALSQLRIKDYVSAREQALKEYKQRYLATISDNLQLLPEETRHQTLIDEMQRMAKLGFDDLPAKTIRIPRQKDGKTLYDENKRPLMLELPVEYSLWWMSDTPEGKLHMIWLSMRAVEGQERTTMEEVESLFTFADDDGQRDEMIEELAQVVGSISETRLAKNGEAPPNAGTEEQRLKERRARRRKRREERRKKKSK